MTVKTMETAQTGSAPIVADLLFWSAVAAGVIAASDSLAGAWGLSRGVLVSVAAAILLSGIAGLVARRTLVGPRLLRWFGLANLAVAAALVLAAVLDALSLTRAGDVALAVGAAAAAAFGLWQLTQARP